MHVPNGHSPAAPPAIPPAEADRTKIDQLTSRPLPGQPERHTLDGDGTAPAPIPTTGTTGTIATAATEDRAGTMTAAPVREYLRHLETAAAAELLAETDAARAELARIDTKAGILLGVSGTAFSVLAALSVLASGLPAPARAGLGGAVTLLAVSSAIALTVIRPFLPRPGTGTGFVAHAALAVTGDPEQLLESLARAPEDRRARDIIRLSAIAHTKYRRLRLAVDVLLAALAVLAITLPLGALA